jgi:hypothetical protein
LVGHAHIADSYHSRETEGRALLKLAEYHSRETEGRALLKLAEYSLDSREQYLRRPTGL